jgi:hypothetical protein
MICLNELEDDFFVQSGLSITWEYYVDFWNRARRVLSSGYKDTGMVGSCDITN